MSGTNITDGQISSATTSIASQNDVYAPKSTLPSERVVNDSVSTESTTHFIDSGTKTSATPEVTSNSTKLDRSRNFVFGNQTLLDFFSKPHVLGDFAFAKTDARNDELAHWDLPEDIFTSNVVLADKLKGFTSLRGDIVIQVQANPAQAHSGKVLFTFEPFQKHKTIEYTSRQDHLTSVTQLPKVEFDLGTDRTARFVIPYRLPTAFLPVAGHDFLDYGRLRVVVYSKLRGADADEVRFTVWTWWQPDTVVLANPTASGYATLLSTAPSKTGGRKRFGYTKKSNSIESNSNTMSTSSMLRAVGSIATAAGMVPAAAPIAAPVAWAAGIAAAGAASLGYSNPRQEKAPTLVIDRHSRDLCTVDQAVPGYVYSFTGAARLGAEPPGGLSKDDEMHFGHLLPLSVYRETINWINTDAAGHRLVDREEIDTLLGKSSTDDFHHYAPWTAIAQMFQYWRGHIRYTVKAAKSRFHTGRLLLVFDCDKDVPITDLSETDTLNRMVIDLEAGNEWTYEIPFPYIDDYAARDAVIGRLSLYVLTPLTTSGTASDSIDLVIETSMRADASFNFFRGRSYELSTMAREGFTKMSNSLNVMKSLPTGALSAIEHTNNVTTPFSDPVDREAACIGEAVRSFRTILKRPFISRSTGLESTFVYWANCPNEDDNDLLRYIQRWYALVRGSYRYTFRMITKGTYLELYTPSEYEVASVDETHYVQWLPKEVFVDVEVPQYNVNPWRISSLRHVDHPMFKYPYLKSRDVVTEFEKGVAAADDFDLCFFIGVHPIAVV